MAKKKHEHRRSRTCMCYPAGLEPNEDCPVHGAGEWPPRCEECGQFMSWESEFEMIETPDVDWGQMREKVVELTPEFFGLGKNSGKLMRIASDLSYSHVVGDEEDQK